MNPKTTVSQSVEDFEHQCLESFRNQLIFYENAFNKKKAKFQIIEEHAKQILELEEEQGRLIQEKITARRGEIMLQVKNNSDTLTKDFNLLKKRKAVFEEWSERKRKFKLNVNSTNAFFIPVLEKQTSVLEKPTVLEKSTAFTVLIEAASSIDKTQIL
jgi:hypothetical protein